MFGKRAKGATVGRCLLQAVKKPIGVLLDFVLSCVRDDERPYLTVDIFGKKMVGLLDSGANQTVAGLKGTKMLKNLGLPIHSTQKIITVANDEKCAVEGIVSVPIKLKDRSIVVEILLVPSIRHELILGTDFWHKMGIVPDLRRGEWTFSKEPPELEVSAIQSRSELSCEDEHKLKALIAEAFDNTSGDELGCAISVEHQIRTDSMPIKQRYYPISPAIQKIVDKELDEMLRLGIVEKSRSAWASPILLVPKKDGGYRFCVDYRQLNRVTQADAYPLPQVSWTLDRLRDAKYLSSIDIKSAYWQIPMSETSKQYTAFTVPNRGLFHFNRMPFGLANAPATWQRYIDEVIGSDLDPHVFVYLDDIVIVTATIEKHFDVLQTVFKRLKAARLTLNKDKCKFFREKLNYLGYVVDGNGLHVDPEKVKAVLEIPIPKKISDVRRMVGMASWYRRFVPNFATVIAPLTALLKKTCKTISWSIDCQNAWDIIKDKLVTAPILTRPDFDKEFIIQTDASDFGLGAVLTQMIDQNEKVICYLSRSLTAQERKYSTTEKECLAVLWAVEKLRPYVEGTHFRVITDHYSLVWLNKLKSPSGRLARWSIRLQQYNFSIEHRNGKDHVVPDMLSRSVPVVVDELLTENANRDPWLDQLKQNIVNNEYKYPNYRVENGKVFKRVKVNYSELSGDEGWREVVHKKDRSGLIHKFHDLPETGGHLGVFKTISKLNQFFYWPKLKSDVMKYIKNCKICQQIKVEQKSPAGRMNSHLDANKPWKYISIDLIGPLPRSTKGFSYILVVLDVFSKFPVCFPLRKATASHVVRCLEDGVFLTYGVPLTVLSDNGVQFRSKEYQKLLKSYNVKSKFTPFYHAQANPTERTNRTIKTMLTAYVNDNHRGWDKFLSRVVCALRTAKNETTKYTPYFVNYGREMILDGELHNKIGDRFKTSIGERTKDFGRLFRELYMRIGSAAERSQARYNLSHREVNFEPGERVWKRNFTLSDAIRGITAKMSKKYVGPYRVRKKVSQESYELEDDDGNVLNGHWHVSHLKPFNNE